MDADYTIVIPTFRSREDLRDLLDEITAAEPSIGDRLIVTGRQGSPAFNRNVGLDAAATPVVVMVDDDLHRFPQFFARDLVSTLRSDSQHVVVTAKLLNANGKMFMGGCFPNRETGIDQSAVRWAPSACIAIYRAAARFDETFPCYEDVDYCMQLIGLKRDAKFVVNNAVQVLHLNEEKWRHDLNSVIGKCRFKDKWGHDIP